MSAHIGQPLRIDARGRVDLVDTDRWVAGLVEQVLFTRPGERVNRATFGAGAAQLVFAPLDDALADATQALIAAALQRELGELVRVDSVAVTAEETTVRADVSYRLLAAPVAGARSIRVSGG